MKNQLGARDPEVNKALRDACGVIGFLLPEDPRVAPEIIAAALGRIYFADFKVDPVRAILAGLIDPPAEVVIRLGQTALAYVEKEADQAAVLKYIEEARTCLTNEVDGWVASAREEVEADRARSEKHGE